jgi:hypothetical protein
MMGTPIRFLGWVPYQGLGIPLCRPHMRNGDLIGHSPGGPDRGASQSATLGWIVPSIPGFLLGRAWGVFARRSVSGLELARRGGQRSTRGSSRNRNRSTGDQQVADFGRGFWQVEKGDFSCVGMQEPGFVESPVRRDRDTDHDRDTDMVVTAERR